MNFNHKKLLMLGNNLSTMDIIEYAQKNGAYVIVTDYIPYEKSKAKQTADEYWDISTSDIDKLYEKAKGYVDGVFCGVSEFNLSCVMELCKRLQLPFYATEEQWKILYSKDNFKELCIKYGVPVIDEIDIDNINSNDFPVIVKPVDSSGSRGISVCNNFKQLEKAIDKALSFSVKKKYIVEKYMTGSEAVLYYYFQEGEPVFIAMCDRYVNKEQVGFAQLPTAYIFPSLYTEKNVKCLDDKVKNMFRNFGIQNGTMFLQSFVDDDGVARFYEPGYRLNGACEQHIINAACGINSSDMMTNYALLRKMSDVSISEQADPYLNGKYACMLSSIIKKGKIAKITGLDEMKKMSSVVKFIMINEVGDEITDRKIGTLAQLGYRAYIVCDTVEQLKSDIDYIIETVVYYDENGNSMMLTPFDTNELLNY